jgi:hypothetical protein
MLAKAMRSGYDGMSMEENEQNQDFNRSDITWLDHAACRNPEVNAELFYSARAVFYKEAIAICGRCPVRKQCLTNALKTSFTDDGGIIAGLTRGDRDEIRLGKKPFPY